MMNLCAGFLIINLTQTPILPQVLSSTQQRCRTVYDACLKKLIKKKEDTYYAICGEGENGSTKRR